MHIHCTWLSVKLFGFLEMQSSFNPFYAMHIEVSNMCLFQIYFQDLCRSVVLSLYIIWLNVTMEYNKSDSQTAKNKALVR